MKPLELATHHRRSRGASVDWDDLRGAAPDATGGLPSEVFVRKIRDDDWPDPYDELASLGAEPSPAKAANAFCAACPTLPECTRAIRCRRDAARAAVAP